MPPLALTAFRLKVTPPGYTSLAPRTFVWAAAEANVARAIRRYLVEERGLPRHQMKISGYWTNGKADAAVKNLDEEAS